MTRVLFVLTLFLFLGPAAWASSRDDLRAAIGSLKEVSSQMGENDDEMAALIAQLDKANSQVATNEEQIQALTALLTTYTARVKQLGDRYTKVIEIAQRLKKDLEWSATLNYIFGGTAAVAVVVAVIGFAR